MFSVAILDLPIDKQKQVNCSIEAASRYGFDPSILIAIAEKEGGKPESKVKNSNGTIDYGLLQVNTVWLNDLRKHGIKTEHVLGDTCYPYHLAAWRIKRHIVYDKNGDLYTKVSNYHSKTKKYNDIYKKDLIKRVAKWQSWFESTNAINNSIGANKVNKTYRQEFYFKNKYTSRNISVSN